MGGGMLYTMVGNDRMKGRASMALFIKVHLG
jgi:hypothetical protein